MSRAGDSAIIALSPFDMKYHFFLLFSFVSLLVLSAINPTDYFTWFLEVIPAIIAVILLIAIYPRFKFTDLVYTLIFFHCVVLIIGGHYTYAEVPLFNWIRDTFGQTRNNYDKVGHFAQGFVPAFVVREILICTGPLRPGKLLSFIVISICLAISALYELFEGLVSFLVGITTGDSVDAFLGTQGDVWDTQWDMTYALIGALLAILLFSRLHDRALASGKLF